MSDTKTHMTDSPCDQQARCNEQTHKWTADQFQSMNEDFAPVRPVWDGWTFPFPAATNITDNMSLSCPTCGVMDSFTMRDYSHKVCIPTKGPSCPQVTEFSGLQFPDSRGAEDVATGSNLARSTGQGVFVCGICGENNCQESAAKQWYQLTGWEFVHMGCWKTLCLKYHTEFLKRDGKTWQNTLGCFIMFLETQWRLKI